MRKFLKYCLIGAAAILFFICVYRANHMSMTHDESGTYMFFHQHDLTQYIIEKELWKSANNHLLNTASIQLSTKIFGQSDFSVRLPNVLSFLLYIISVFGILKLLFTQTSSKLLAFTLLLLNPYSFEFFSLARGYGLSMAFQLFSIWQFLRYLKKEETMSLVLAYVGLGLASFSIFTNLLLIPSFTAGLWLAMLFRHGKKLFSNYVELIVVPLVCIVFIAILSYVPITALSDINEFKWGAKDIFKMNLNLTKDSLYGKKYLGKDTTDIMSVILATTLIISILFGIFSSRIGKVKQDTAEFKFVSWSFIFVLLGLCLSYYLLDSKFPDGRKSTMFIPLIGVVVALFFDRLSYNSIKYLKVFVAFLLILHFGLTLKLNSVREWWYDAGTKTFIQSIERDAKGEEVTIGTNWLFHPTLKYYIITNDYKNLDLGKYSKKLLSEPQFDYFLATGSDWPILGKKYDVLEKSKSGMMLLKKK